VRKLKRKPDKEKSANDNTFCDVTFDSKAFCSPVSEIGPLYHKRKLTLHNFTVYESSSIKLEEAFVICGPNATEREVLLK